MPERQVDIDMAMHELSQRLRAGWEERQADWDKSVEGAKEAVRKQWEMEEELARQKSPQPEPEQDRGPGIHGPDMDR